MTLPVCVAVFQRAKVCLTSFRNLKDQSYTTWAHNFFSFGLSWRHGILFKHVGLIIHQLMYSVRAAHSWFRPAVINPNLPAAGTTLPPHLHLGDRRYSQEGTHSAAALHLPQTALLRHRRSGSCNRGWSCRDLHPSRISPQASNPVQYLWTRGARKVDGYHGTIRWGHRWYGQHTRPQYIFVQVIDDWPSNFVVTVLTQFY